MSSPNLGAYSVELFLAFCCIAFNAFFVIAEFSIVKVRPSRVRELAENNHRGAALLSRIVDDLDRYLSTTQLGITVMSLGLGWLGEPAVKGIVEELLPQGIAGRAFVAHTLAIGLSFGFLTYVQIVVGELVPRALAIRHAEAFALAFAPFLLVLRRVLNPFLAVFDRSARMIVAFMGVTGKGTEKLTEEELRLVLIESLGKGAMADAKVDLIDNVFDFSRRTAKHVMIARDDIISIDLTEPLEKNLAKAKHNNHTRYPLCEGSVDQIVGLVNFKDILWQSEYNREHIDLRNIRREILFVPENKPLTKLLKDFQRNRIHMAIVIDEFGVTSGLVTLEDVLEELVGEIQDEYDQETSRIQLMRDGSYLVEGGTLIEEVEEKLGIEIPKEDNTTIAGAVLSQIGRLPRVGDSAEMEGFSFLVKSLKGRRIHSLQIRKKK